MGIKVKKKEEDGGSPSKGYYEMFRPDTIVSKYKGFLLVRTLS